MSTPSTSIFKDPNVTKHLFFLHDKYVIVSADKARQFDEGSCIHTQNLTKRTFLIKNIYFIFIE
jgi:hypothetical protein